MSIHDPFPLARGEAGGETAAEESGESTATWAPMDPSLFQQDMSETLEPRTLTTWGDANADADDPDANWPPEPGTDVFFPEIDGDDLSKWLPAPEEQPVDELEYSLEAVDLAAEARGAAFRHRRKAGGLVLFGDIRPEPPDPIRTSEQVENAGDRHRAQRWPPRGSAAAPPGSGVQQPDHRRTSTSSWRRDRQAEFSVSVEPAPAVTRPWRRRCPRSPNREPAGVRGSRRRLQSPQRDPEEMREIEAGLAKFKRVVQVNPKNARAWDTLGNLYKSAGEYEEALRSYQEAIKNDPTKALYHHHVGLVYACEGRIDEAIDAFQSVIQMDPDHALAHAALGGYYRKKGLEDLAQKHIGIAMKSIFDSENEYNRACLAAICGNTEQALELLRVALNNKQTYVDWILRDPDLDFIRQDPRFKQLISDYAR